MSKRERSEDESGVKDLRTLMNLPTDKKIMVLACMSPCGNCVYYCSVSGTPDNPCLRCHQSARAHGNLSDDNVDEKMRVFIAILLKLNEDFARKGKDTPAYNVYDAIMSLMRPVTEAVETELRAEPPFEEPTMQTLMITYVRYVQVIHRGDAEATNTVRKGIVTIRNFIDSAFLRLLDDMHKADRAALDADPFFRLAWERCHQCPEDKLCTRCQEERVRGVVRSGEVLKVSDTFGALFLKHFEKELRNGIHLMKARLPQDLKVPEALEGFSRELALGRCSIVFSEYAMVRMMLMPHQQEAVARLTKGGVPRQAPATAPPDVVDILSPSTKRLRGAEAQQALKSGDAFHVKVVTESGSESGWPLVMGLKEVISKQLPEMPKYYIMRALFDGNHQSLCVSKGGSVVGGCCFRPFLKQGFVEIVFLAVDPDTTNKGLGSLIMNQVKVYVYSALKLSFLITYADNTAIEFFKKQGFTRDISLPRSKWGGYIKDYTKATMMEYAMSIQRDAAIAQQATWAKACAALMLDKTPVKDGLNKRTNFPVKPKAIGVEPDDQLQAKMRRILLVLKRSRYIGPFLKPVDPSEAPNYLTIIKNPIALSDIEKKLNTGAYTEMENFESDLKLICTNCFTYNGESSWYYKSAEKLQEQIQRLV